MGIYTNTARMTGTSGIDVESMVSQLMKAESLKYNKLIKDNQLLAWKQESYRSTSTALDTFKKAALDLGSSSSIRFSKSFTSMSSNITGNTSAAKIIPSSSAQEGSHTLEVQQIAASDKYKSTASVKSDIKGVLSDNVKDGDTIDVTLDGQTKTITLINSTDKTAFQDDLRMKLRDAFGSEAHTLANKVSADVNATTGELVIKTTEGHTIGISETKNKINTTTATNAVQTQVGDVSSTFEIQVNGKGYSIDLDLADGDDPNAIVQKLNIALTKANNGTGTDNITNNVVASLDADGKIVISGKDLKSDVSITSGDTSGGKADALGILGIDSGATIGKTTVVDELGIKSGATNKINTSDTLADVFGDAAFDSVTGLSSFSINGETFDFAKTDSLQSLLDQVNNSSKADTKISFNSLTASFILEGKTTGAMNALNITDSNSFLKDAMKIDITDPAAKLNAAQDSVILFDNVLTSRTNNEFNINDISITVSEVTDPANPINIEVSKNTGSSKQVIKDFVENYNKMIDAMNATVNTSRPKSGSYSFYDPLTSDEKKELSESEVKAWEDKAKTGLLYRDPTIQSIGRKMREMLYTPVDTGGGRQMSLYEIGITTTSDLKSPGKLVIDEDKLTEALALRGADVEKMFTKTSEISSLDKSKYNQRLASEGIGDRLNDIINSAISTTGTLTKIAGQPNSSTQNENTYSNKIKAKSEETAKMLNYLQSKENYYYGIFSRMESAMNSANSQLSYLQSM